MQINRFLSLNEIQFLGCTSAFIDTLSGELNSAITFLKRLEGKRKGSAFAFEMQLDQHRYGALIVLERWANFTRAFKGNVELGMHQPIFDQAVMRAESSQKILEQTNHVMDQAEFYTSDIIEVCAMAYRTVELTFQDERSAADKATSLGPMLPEEFKEYRRVFLGDLSHR